MLVFDVTLNQVLSIIAGAVVGLIFATFFYSPVAFQARWLEALGKTTDEVQPIPLKFLINTIFVFLGSAVISWILVNVGADNLLDVFLVAVMLWVFYLMAAYGAVAFENYPENAYYLNALFSLIFYVLMSVTIQVVADLNLL